MDRRTRQQLLRINADFYRAHATGFDASRGHQPWPGWLRLRRSLPEPAESSRLRVLDVGCGNARLATFLAEAGFGIEYVGVDADRGLLDAARTRLPPELRAHTKLLEHDFLASPRPGSDLPQGPFDLVALFGVLHHVPGADWRAQLIGSLAERLRAPSASQGGARGGVLALAAWQFAARPRFERRRVDWSTYRDAEDQPIDPRQLDPGDFLLRFGSDPSMPPRYCHQVSDEELDEIASKLEGPDVALEDVDDFRADGGEGDLNRYRVFRRL